MVLEAKKAIIIQHRSELFPNSDTTFQPGALDSKDSIEKRFKSRFPTIESFLKWLKSERKILSEKQFSAIQKFVLQNSNASTLSTAFPREYICRTTYTNMKTALQELQSSETEQQPLTLENLMTESKNSPWFLLGPHALGRAAKSPSLTLP